ncbi:MAG: RidA family protein [Nitrososphaeraceae archaeon]|nr:RidA family protein [Nitrososphaeraceae archaeon]
MMTGSKMQRKNVSSGTQWELALGYSRVVRLGDSVYVSGTTATDKEGHIVGVANPYAQTIQVIKNIQTALQAVGASLKDVVRTRMYVTDINNWKKVGQAHAEFFKEIRPASTLVEVSRLINPEILVEMEVDAIIVNTSQYEIK